MKHPASEPGNGGVTYREGCSSGDGRRSLMKSAPDPPMTLGNAAKALRLIVRCWSYGPRRAGPQRAWGTARLLCRTSRLALLLAFAVIPPLGIALGQTAPGSPIVSDLPVASGTERVLFLGAQGARALVILLPGSDGIIGLDSGGGVHQLGGNFLVRTIVNGSRRDLTWFCRTHRMEPPCSANAICRPMPTRSAKRSISAARAPICQFG